MKIRLYVSILVVGALLCSCGKPGPGEVLQEAITHISNGECEKAMPLASEEGRWYIQGTIDAGCQKYELEIKSIVCEINEDRAWCTCEQINEYGPVSLSYPMLLENEEWKLDVRSKEDIEFNDDSE